MGVGSGLWCYFLIVVEQIFQWRKKKKGGVGVGGGGGREFSIMVICQTMFQLHCMKSGEFNLMNFLS